MLVAAIVTVTAPEPAEVPAFLGRAVQAWFLGLVRQHSPAMAEALHMGDGPRPYTVSNLFGAGSVRGGRLLLEPGRAGSLRITTLVDDLSGLLVERILPALPGTPMDLGGAVLRVESVTTRHADHPWAGRASAPGLVAAHTLNGTDRRLSLRFVSPTTFRSEGNNVVFPLPELVFGNLITRWNTFSPVTFHEDAKRFARERVVASKFDLHSAYTKFSRDEHGAAVGCVGTCRYHIQSGDRYWGGVIRTLAAYTFFAGIGAHTAIGMGQSALWDEEARRPITVGWDEV